jgi:hypothetical protein
MTLTLNHIKKLRSELLLLTHSSSDVVLALAFYASNAHKKYNIHYSYKINMSGTLHEYLWIAIAGGIFGFVYTFSIGANDVANAFVRIAT